MYSLPDPSGSRLENKVAIVTGAGTTAYGDNVGTGEAISILLARHGAKVLVADLEAERAERTRQTIVDAGGEASILVADVTSQKDCKRMVDTCVERYGGLHILVNNAGAGKGGKVTEIDSADFDSAIDVNLKGAAMASKYAIPAMGASGGGSIVHVVSVDGLRAGWFPNVPYSAAKAAVINMSTLIACHHGAENIRSNCVAPGHIYGSFIHGSLSPELRDLRRRAAPLGTEGNAWDIAWATVFLASDEARWISGVVLPVDGGLTTATPLAMREQILT